MTTMDRDQTVTGLFDSITAAQQAVETLERAGVPRSNISIIAGNESGKYKDYIKEGEDKGDPATGAAKGAAIGGGLGLLAGLAALAIPGVGPIIAAGPIVTALAGAGIGAAAGGLIGALANAGIPEEDARMYADEVQRGGILVIVRTRVDHADQVADILADAGARDVNEKAPDTVPVEAREKTSERPAMRGEVGSTGKRTSIPVVEEELAIGKRDVRRGGVRVYPVVHESAVEKQIPLRGEKIKVDRRPADRPASPDDLRSFEEGTIELTETDEEPVVVKNARVVEEVIVFVEGDERTETIRETVRRGDVEVERIDLEDEDDFRRDFESRHGGAGTYEEYAPAYRFGRACAGDPRYRTGQWSSVEPELKRDWEAKGRTSWERFKDSIRHGWERVRGS
jgi:uncharacterized protein (TIGR02271 family)